ncbi:MAG: hypothetical protein ACK2U2_06025, partial [Anaerolineae bacterium]
MPTPFEKLEKILKLEQSQGFRNTAVIGGLDGFAGIWRKEALDETQDQARIEQINDMADRLQRYAEADASARNETVSLLLDQLAEDLQPRTLRQPPLQKPGGAPPQQPPPPPLPKEEPPAAAPSQSPATGLDAPVTTLPGVSTAYTTRLRRLGIETVGDLLYHFPYRYDDYSSLKPIDQLE